MQPISLGLIGATGAVGQEVLRLLEEKGFPLRELRCFASAKSAGTTLPFRGENLVVHTLSKEGLAGLDIALFSAGRKISFTFAPEAVAKGVKVVDNSSAFRMREDVPLIVPEVNLQALQPSHQIIAVPNCCAILLSVVIAPLMRAVPIERLVIATYQAASGAGLRAMQELQEETAAVLEGKSYKRSIMPHPYAFNLFPHNSPFDDAVGYAEEEIKIQEELRKILNAPKLPIHATCVRVPVLRAHSMAVNITFSHPFEVERAYEVLKSAEGVEVVEERASNRFAMPVDATCQDKVLCGRIRKDPSCPNTLDLWIVGDQLRKGAALNALQIAMMPQILKAPLSQGG
ncbi:MAG: hypothetical protein RLZZ453_1166 [Chlamydiota bacterium]|jgi:aspartate-semialdehyde dehydrogenase